MRQVLIFSEEHFMQMTNYWWQLIWLFIGGAIMRIFPKRQEQLGERTVERWDYLPAILMVIPYIVWAGYRNDSFGDTLIYRQTFRETTADLSQIFSFFSNDTKDPGFSAFTVLFKAIFGNQDKLFFLLIAAFQMLCLALTLRKYTADYWVCLFLFVASTDYMSWAHNGMRQFIAITAIFAGFELMLKKKYIPMIILILLVSTIHGSALLMLPIIFVIQGRAWNRKTILVLIITAIGIIYIDRFTPILNKLLQNTQYDDMMTNEIWTNDNGTNIIRVLVYSVPALLSLVGLRYVRTADDPVINLSVNCSIVTMALYAVAAVSSGIYIGRLPMYTTLQGYIALPWLIDHMFTRESAKLVRISMIVLFVAFFYYQMHITWRII